MKVFVNKCTSEVQKDQSCDFDDEWDLDEEILSEGTTVRSTMFENNMQHNMEKVCFKTKKMLRRGKWKQPYKILKESMKLELSHAVERRDVLLEVWKTPNSPCLSVNKAEESKSNKSYSKINSSFPTHTTLKDEIRQLLRWLAQERKNSLFISVDKDHTESLKLDNRNWCHLEVNTKK